MFYFFSRHRGHANPSPVSWGSGLTLQPLKFLSEETKDSFGSFDLLVASESMDYLPKITFPETNIAPKNTAWKRRFLLETIIFGCYVSFREGKLKMAT